MPFEGKLQTIQSVFSQVASRGWEIGLHGSIESAFTPGMLETQRLDIEKAVGSQVVSGRQHNLQFGAAVTPDLIAASGLKVDCTLGSNRTAFFRTGTSYPHKLWSVSKKDWLDVLEIPLVLHDGALLRADNLDLSPDSAFRFCRKIIERAAAVRGVVSLLWHPENILKPGYFELYCRLLDLLKEMGAWGTSARQIADWWQSSGNAKIVEVAMEENLSEVKV
jgi:peptidoglycan/xylan/chitin deacetylase (PgdA/CDA1 family)